MIKKERKENLNIASLINIQTIEDTVTVLNKCQWVVEILFIRGSISHLSSDLPSYHLNVCDERVSSDLKTEYEVNECLDNS